MNTSKESSDSAFGYVPGIRAPTPPPPPAPELKGIDWNSSKFDILLDSFVPFSPGIAKVMDKYLSDERASYHETVESQGIKFDDPDADDPDWKVKQCIALLLLPRRCILR